MFKRRGRGEKEVGGGVEGVFEGVEVCVGMRGGEG